ncbi:MAG: caspase domain-containing protein [Rhodomicrobium sp.]
MRALVKIVLAALMLAVAGQAAFAERRVALVIGNGAYVNAPALTNPKNDAEDMAAVLKKLGFKVILGIDLDKRAMDSKILEFANALSGAETGVFHYSGHGLQVAGVNYLVPVDAKLETAAALDFEAVRLDLVQRTMEREAKTNILFLDACRNNPLARNLARAFGTRSADIGRGLAATEAGAGTLISFSTQPGNVALDGSGRNSPYSGPLGKAIGTPGEDVLSILTTVRKEVMAMTSDHQVPWDNNALTAKFYFNPAPFHAGPAPNEDELSPPIYEDREAQMHRKIEQFIVQEHLQNKEHFASQVDYFDKGLVSRDFAIQHSAKYAQKWPSRYYKLVPRTLKISPNGSGRYVAVFQYEYRVSNSIKTLKGRGYSTLYLTVEGDRFVVTGVKENIQN